MDGPGSQLWRIKTPDGNVTELYSTNPSSARLLGYEFISQHQHVYTGLRVLNTNSTWNGTTFQCIAYTPSNTTRVNDSAAAVTLKVGGKCRLCVCLNFVPSVRSQLFLSFMVFLKIKAVDRWLIFDYLTIILRVKFKILHKT